MSIIEQDVFRIPIFRRSVRNFPRPDPGGAIGVLRLANR